MRWLATLVALGGATAAAAADLPDIQKARTLRVAYVVNNTLTPGESPFFVVAPDGAARGFDAEVLERFCKLHGLKMVLVPQPDFETALTVLPSGKADVLAGNITATDTRRKTMDFTTEVLPTRFVVVTRRPHRVIRTVAELRAERVGTTRGTTRHEAAVAAGVPAANIDDTLTQDGFLAALQTGRISVAIVEAYTATVLQRTDPDIQPGLFLGPPQSLAYAVRKDSPALLKALNDHIGQARTSPVWVQLLTRYFGATASDMLRKARE